MRFKALRHQPSDAARKSGYDNEGQLPDTLPDSRSRPLGVIDQRPLLENAGSESLSDAYRWSYSASYAEVP